MTPEERKEFEKTLADLKLPEQPAPDMADMTMSDEDLTETTVELPEIETPDSKASAVADVNEAFRDGAGGMAVQILPGNDVFTKDYNQQIQNVEPDLDRYEAGQQSLPEIDAMMRDTETHRFPVEDETFRAKITPPQSDDEGRVHESSNLGTDSSTEFERNFRNYLEANERAMRSVAETLARHALALNNITDGLLRSQN